MQTMRVYSGTGYGRGTIFVSPGTEHPEITEWMKTVNGTTVPQQLTVKFENGAADVSANLGQYLIRSGYAFANPVDIPLPAAERAEGKLGERPNYQTPIPVGRPITVYEDLVRRGLA